MNFFIFLVLISNMYLSFWFFYTFSFTDWWFIPTLITIFGIELVALTAWKDE